jgi:hypothetical protein
MHKKMKKAMEKASPKEKKVLAKKVKSMKAKSKNHY